MCGILAIVSFRNHERHISKLNQMAGMMRHRGPDDEGYVVFDVQNGEHMVFSGPDTPVSVRESNLAYSPRGEWLSPPSRFSVGLAHRRLAIIDLAPTGHQPMSDQTGRYWIVYNGEVYNFLEIREELLKRGHNFLGQSDTEVVLNAFKEWGPGCQKRFNGMWAFVIWDNVEKRLWISRDRFGVKPLYYFLHEDFFAVCSEIKCVMPLTTLVPNLQEAYAYLVDGPNESHSETFFQGAYRFPAGSSATFDAKRGAWEPSFQKYWELSEPAKDTTFSEGKLKAYSEEYYDLLRDAVKIRMYADVKVSCALSGGLDSSSVTFLAHEVLALSGNGSSSLATVSNVYADRMASDCDESHFIEKMIAWLNVVNYRGEPDYTRISEINDYGLWCYENCYDELPIAAMNTFEICRRNGIKVNLDGQGADEINAGYLRYWMNYFASQLPMSADYLVSLYRAPIAAKEKVKAVLRLSNLERSTAFLRARLEGRISEGYRAARISQKEYVGVPVNEALYRSIHLNLKKLLRNVDCYSMAVSVESRQPYMDYRLIEFLNSIPSCYKIREGWTKYLARTAFNEKLPQEIVWRRDKLGWPQPIGYWLSGIIASPVYRSIRKSRFLEEVLGKIGDEDLRMLQKMPRIYLRLYNLARNHEIFCGKGIQTACFGHG